MAQNGAMNNENLTIFLAGIIQGSMPVGMHDQEYRHRLARLFSTHLPGAAVFDPVAVYPGSLEYDAERGRDAFFDLMDRAGQADVLVAFLPEASMGTAIEMWNAYHAGSVIVCVSPLAENWVVRFLADLILPDLAALEQALTDGRLRRLLEEKIDFTPDAV